MNQIQQFSHPQAEGSLLSLKSCQSDGQSSTQFSLRRRKKKKELRWKNKSTIPRAFYLQNIPARRIGFSYQSMYQYVPLLHLKPRFLGSGLRFLQCKVIVSVLHSSYSHVPRLQNLWRKNTLGSKKKKWNLLSAYVSYFNICSTERLNVFCRFSRWMTDFIFSLSNCSIGSMLNKIVPEIYHVDDISKLGGSPFVSKKKKNKWPRCDPQSVQFSPYFIPFWLSFFVAYAW